MRYKKSNHKRSQNISETFTVMYTKDYVKNVYFVHIMYEIQYIDRDLIDLKKKCKTMAVEVDNGNIYLQLTFC